MLDAGQELKHKEIEHYSGNLWDGPARVSNHTSLPACWDLCPKSNLLHEVQPVSVTASFMRKI